MRKQILKFNVLVAVLVLVIVVSLGFTSTKKTEENVHNINRVTKPLAYSVSLEDEDVEDIKEEAIEAEIYNISEDKEGEAIINHGHP